METGTAAMAIEMTCKKMQLINDDELHFINSIRRNRPGNRLSAIFNQAFSKISY
jgi:hypothetical protein